MNKRVRISLLSVVALFIANTTPAYATQDYVQLSIINVQPRQFTVLAVGANYLLRRSVRCLAEAFSYAQNAKIAFISEPTIGDAKRALTEPGFVLDYYQSLMVTVFWVEEVTTVTYEVSPEVEAEWKRCSPY